MNYCCEVYILFVCGTENGALFYRETLIMIVSADGMKTFDGEVWTAAIGTVTLFKEGLDFNFRFVAAKLSLNSWFFLQEIVYDKVIIGSYDARDAFFDTLLQLYTDDIKNVIRCKRCRLIRKRWVPSWCYVTFSLYIGERGMFVDASLTKLKC